MLRLLQVFGIALLAGSPAIVLFCLEAHQDEMVFFDVSHSMGWGASLNSLVVPSVYHPIGWIREFARSVYTGPYNESGVANLGTVTVFLALVGLIAIFREREIRRYAWVFPLLLSGGVLSLGLLLKWNGEVVTGCAFRSLNTFNGRQATFLSPACLRALNRRGLLSVAFPCPVLC